MSNKTKLDYIYGAIPNAVPAGLIIVHNRVAPRTPKARTGPYGFRCWFAKPSPLHVRCDCPWAPHLRRHFRILLPEVES
jgi:hypothetical protein